ncbi:MAG: AbrB/MazE/SpoVT family DNA-binding domain-containing protein [Dehalococcoidia bacterium]|nr:MAG: AbrB/MazE/SpoVT family DNA-binding domain-containing protein [Dehalococcoidia bacterium]TET46376.1 MAG: AbrB/MazE/SpoVT family DNA-binding domain-containing protein [Dehalococcoidia bacterium]
MIKSVPGCQCQVDALITIDGRGQIVLPKEVREKADINAGDKFVVISHQSGGKGCCLFLIKADFFSETVKNTLEPLVRDILE